MADFTGYAINEVIAFAVHILFTGVGSGSESAGDGTRSVDEWTVSTFGGGAGCCVSFLLVWLLCLFVRWILDLGPHQHFS